MKLSGWVFLALSWGLIIWLCGFCFREMFRQHQRRKHG